MDINHLLTEAVRLNASDLHITVGMPPMYRISKRLLPLAGAKPLKPEDAERLVFSTLSEENKKIFIENKELDYSVGIQNARFRVNAYYQRSTLSAAFRLIPNKIRNFEELHLPRICQELSKLHQGLVLVTGPTGHGKSTTLAAMIQYINMTRAEHIITVEDPIEYVYPIGMSIISQREMRADTLSWSKALRSVLREDPDVVLVGEMRDFDTIQATLTIAETGHLVFATLHTNSASQTVDRIIDVFPEHQQNQVRIQLASVLEAVLSQRLMPSVDGGVTPMFEIMTATPALRATVRDSKTHLIDNIIQTSREQGMITLEASLARGVKEGKITIETATQYAVRPQDLARLLK